MNGPVAEFTVRADDGVALSARSRGRGHPLVLCHGGPGLWDNLDDLAAILGELFTVWTYDQRGCGRSAGREGPHTIARFVADLDAVRKATGYDRVAVGGHSWGAVLALLYAATHPSGWKACSTSRASGSNGRSGVPSIATRLEGAWSPSLSRSLRLRRTTAYSGGRSTSPIPPSDWRELERWPRRASR